VIAIGGATRVAAVLGWPIEHSRSPAMLNAAFAAAALDAVMIPIGVSPDGLPAVIAALRAMRALGASVTVPHKVAVGALCDELAPEARAIGAVNCLELGERVIGHNTDCHGFSDALAAAGFDVAGTRVVLLGAGGAARAVAYAVRGARHVDVVARRPEAATWTAVTRWTPEALRDALARADLVVDCTPAGLHAEADTAFADAVPLDALAPGAWVVSLVYHRRTSLLERASRRGHSTLDGAAMLVHQGARAFAIWTGRPV
jgi:shikimate dehydrogenase